MNYDKVRIESLGYEFAPVVVTDGSFEAALEHRLVGGGQLGAPQYHALCRWGLDTFLPARQLAQSIFPKTLTEYMSTDSASVMRHGVELGMLVGARAVAASGSEAVREPGREPG